MYRSLAAILFALCLALPVAAQPATTGQIKPRFWNAGTVTRQSRYRQVTRRYQRKKRFEQGRFAARRPAIPVQAHVAAGRRTARLRFDKNREARFRRRRFVPRFYNRKAPSGSARRLYVEQWTRERRRRANQGSTVLVK